MIPLGMPCWGGGCGRWYGVCAHRNLSCGVSPSRSWYEKYMSIRLDCRLRAAVLCIIHILKRNIHQRFNNCNRTLRKLDFSSPFIMFIIEVVAEVDLSRSLSGRKRRNEKHAEFQYDPFN